MRKVLPSLSKAATPRSVRIVLIGTFYNTGWLVAHATPLAKCGSVDEVIVVCDEALPLELPKLTYQCPSSRLRKIMGRSLARFTTLMFVGLKVRPQVYMGYHIMPNGALALWMARIWGGKAIYQMTGGPIQIIHGGPGSENRLLAATKTPSRILEWLMFSMVRCFDAVVVRGKSAEEFISKNRLARSTYIITGAIDTEIFKPDHDEKKTIDVLYVARLIPGKGYINFIEAVSILQKDLPAIRAVVAGDGPMLDKLSTMVGELGLTSNVEFIGKSSEIPNLLAKSKVYMLLSDTEGMSIAVLEAMGSGVPVIVTRVGELADVVDDGVTGFLVEPHGFTQEIVDKARLLLSDKSVQKAIGNTARLLIKNEYSVSATSCRWHRILQELCCNDRQETTKGSTS